MTRNEFNSWLEDFQTRFPDSKRWMREHVSTVELWFVEIFSTLSLRHCLEANRSLMHSDDPIRAYERETIAARVRREARRIAFHESEGGDKQAWKQNHRAALRDKYVPLKGEGVGELFRIALKEKQTGTP